MRCLGATVAAIAVGVGYIIATSPAAVQPLVIPETSMVRQLPPWPLFRFFIGLNNLLRSAAELTTPPEIRALELANSYWQSIVAYSMVAHGTLDTLSELGRAASCYEVANVTGKQAHYLCRFMHAASTLGILKELKDDEFSITAVGEELRTGSRDRTIWLHTALRHSYIATAEKSIQSGVPGHVEYTGMSIWEWHDENQAEAKLFDGAMKDFAKHTAYAVVSELPLRGDELLCDVGGGIGTLLAILWEHWPTTSVMLLDLPATVERADAFFAQRGVVNATTIAGSFLEPLPEEMAACDVFFLKNIMHDWDDETCVRILANVKQRAKPGASVAVVDAIMGSDGLSFERAKAVVEGGVLSTCPAGAKERTLVEFRNLFKRAGILSPDDEVGPQVIKLREVLSVLQAPL